MSGSGQADSIAQHSHDSAQSQTRAWPRLSSWIAHITLRQQKVKHTTQTDRIRYGNAQIRIILPQTQTGRDIRRAVWPVHPRQRSPRARQTRQICTEREPHQRGQSRAPAPHTGRPITHTATPASDAPPRPNPPLSPRRLPTRTRKDARTHCTRPEAAHVRASRLRVSRLRVAFTSAVGAPPSSISNINPSSGSSSGSFWLPLVFEVSWV